MIESKILGEAVGIQYQGEKDLSETTNPSKLTKATFVGRFKRGIMGRPFKVTRDNYQALLGADNNNPDYMAVADTLSSGVPEVTILRIGAVTPNPAKQSAGSNTGSSNTPMPNPSYAIIP